MKTVRRLVRRAPAVGALVGLALARPAHGQEPTPAQIDSIVRRVIAEQGVVGLSVGVMQNGA